MGDLARAREGLTTNSGHDQARKRLIRQYAAMPPGSPIRLTKRTSNLFRSREKSSGPGLDVGGARYRVDREDLVEARRVQAWAAALLTRSE